MQIRLAATLKCGMADLEVRFCVCLSKISFNLNWTVFCVPPWSQIFPTQRAGALDSSNFVNSIFLTEPFKPKSLLITERITSASRLAVCHRFELNVECVIISNDETFQVSTHSLAIVDELKDAIAAARKVSKNNVMLLLNHSVLSDPSFIHDVGIRNGMLCVFV